MTSYIYDGELSPETAAGARNMMRKYPNVVEVREIPPYEWIKENLPEHTYWTEDDFGTNYETKGRLYGIVRKDRHDPGAGSFFFLKTAAEKQLVIDGLPRLVINRNPFKTMINT
jgi:hypothetical protein